MLPSRAPATYPCFNSPPELAYYLDEQCGFDVLNLANNHCLDQGTSGLEECLSFWKENYPDILTTGVYQNAEDQGQYPHQRGEWHHLCFFGHDRTDEWIVAFI